jgi:O-antigen/teichoic acid export membrane protein
LGEHFIKAIKGILNDQFLQDVAKILSSNILSRLILISATPIITRLYLPQDYGIAAIILNFISVLTAFSCLRYDAAIVLGKDENESRHLFYLTCIINFTVTLSLVLILTATRKQIVALFHLPEDFKNFIWLIAVGVFFSGFGSSLISWSNWKKQFGKYSKALIGHSVTTSGVKILLGAVFKSSPIFIIIGNISGSIFSSLYLLSRSFYFRKIKIDWKLLKYVARKYREFPIYNTPTVVVRRLGQHMPIFLFGFFFDPKIVGFYSLAITILHLPITTISVSVTKVITKEISEKYNNDVDFKDDIIKSLKILAAIFIFPTLVLIFFGKESFVLVFSEKWEIAGLYASILAPWMFFEFVNPGIISSYLVLRKQKFLFFFQTILFSIRISALFICGLLTEDPVKTLILFSAINVTASIYHFLYIINALNLQKKKLASAGF